jgi:hypothetical protein
MVVVMVVMMVMRMLGLRFGLYRFMRLVMRLMHMMRRLRPKLRTRRSRINWVKLGQQQQSLVRRCRRLRARGMVRRHLHESIACRTSAQHRHSDRDEEGGSAPSQANGSHPCRAINRHGDAPHRQT